MDNNNISNVVYCLVFCIIILFITSYTVSSNFECNLSKETRETNRNERIVSWIMMSLSLSFIITIIILSLLQNRISKEYISTIYKIFTIILGILSIIVSISACDHFGRNNKSNLIFFILTFIIFTLLLNFRI